MSDWTIAIPSFGRAGRVTSDAIFHDALIVVPESQAEEYAEQKFRNGCTLVTLPDDRDGNIARKRNWIMDQYPGNLLIVDDDYDYVGMVENEKQVRLGWESIHDLLLNGFSMARELGTVLWGLNLQVDPKFYRPYSPLAFLAPVLGPWQGFVDCDLRHDEDLWLKEDYDLSLQVFRKYHRTLRFNKYHYMVDHFNAAGGIVGTRHMPEEVRQLERLQRKWGSGVVSYDLSRSVNPRIRVPLSGI